MLRRHKPYAESDHILTLVYNLLSGGETLNDINRLADDPALLRVLGTEQVPHATTVGDFLARFRHEKDEAKGQEPRRLRKLRAGDRDDPTGCLCVAGAAQAHGGDPGLGLLES